MEWEPYAAETPPRAAPDGPGLSAEMTSPGPPGQGEGAACDAAGAARREERDVQPTSDGHETKQVPPVSSKWAGEANELSSLRFPEKLWKMVESDWFQSIWWSDQGRCIAINEKLFQEEVLGDRGSLRVFATQNIKSFTRQLNLYGFMKIQRDFERSASLPEFLAEEAAAAAHSQILYYYNPSFNRDHPQLLERCQRRVAPKRRAPHVPAMDEGHPSSSAGAQTTGDMQASPPTKRWAEAAPGPSSARPSPPAAAPAARRSPRQGEVPPLALCFPPPPGTQTPGGLQDAARAPPPFAAASAVLGPRPPHCPTCTCTTNPVQHILERAESWQDVNSI